MFERFRAHLNDSGLVPSGIGILAGYSGGADSTALLHMLKRCGKDVVAAHLHHGQRPEADEEMARCQRFAEEIGVPFLSGRADVPRMSAEMRIGIEEAGREARYAFFRQAAASTNCALVTTAHTRNDQMETILMNITRGSGLHGLAGIPERRDNIVRPLLPFSREETKAYCREHGLWTHDDPANTDLAYSRARIRSLIVPELMRINPNLDAALVRLATTADEEDRFLNGMAAAALEQAEAPLNGELRFLTEDAEIRFDRQRLAHLPPVLQKRAVRLTAEALGGQLNFEQTQLAAAGIAGHGNGSITAEGGEVVVEWSNEWVDVRRLVETVPFRYGLTIPGETMSDDFGWQITAFEASSDGAEQRRASLQAAVAASAVKGPLHFRSLNAGDSMQPLGFFGRRKIADLLSEAKLTQAARTRLPIVCDMIGPLWIPGVCLDERVRLNDASKTVIILRFGTLGSQGWHNIRNERPSTDVA